MLEHLKSTLPKVPDKAIRRALRFAWLVASQWSSEPLGHQVLGAAQLYAARLRRLRGGRCAVWRVDNRRLRVKAGCVISSPPYPGVYDYLAEVKKAEAIGLRWEEAEEIGRREAWRQESFEDWRPGIFMNFLGCRGL